MSRSRGSMNLRLLSTLGVILGAIGWAGGGDRAGGKDEVANLTARSAEANAALVRGDIDTLPGTHRARQ